MGIEEDDDVDEATLRRVIGEEIDERVNRIAEVSGHEALAEINRAYAKDGSVIRTETVELVDVAVAGSVAHRGVLATGDDPGVWWWVTAAGTRVAVDPVLAQRLYASKLVRVQAVDPLAPYPWPQAELDQVPVAAPAVPPTG